VKYGSPNWIKIGREIDESQLVVIIGTAGSYYSYGMALEVNAALNLKKTPVTLKHNDAKIFEILYGPEFAHFDNEQDLNKICLKIHTEFDSIIQQHREHMLRLQLVGKQGNLPSQPILTFGESKEPTADVTGLNVSKVDRVESEIRSAYEKFTIIPSLAQVRQFNAVSDSTKVFTQIFVSFFHPIRDFTEEQPALIMLEVGMAVALGERNFINERLFDKGPVVEMSKEEVTVQKIRDIVRDLKQRGFQPNVMLAPLQHYVDYMQAWLQEDPHSIVWDGPQEYLVINSGERLRVVWSNSYVPYNDFLIMDRRIGEWVVKPDPKGRALITRISRSTLYPESRVEVLAKTVVHYELRAPNGMRILKLIR
jgi:hypothetical protein